MFEKVLMNELTRFMKGTRWEKKTTPTGNLVWYIYDGIETIDKFHSLHEAEFYLNKIIKG